MNLYLIQIETGWPLFLIFHFPWLFPDFSLSYNVFSWLHFVSGIAKSNIDNFYPLTKYGNTMCNVNISLCNNVNFQQTFPRIFHQQFFP